MWAGGVGWRCRSGIVRAWGGARRGDEDIAFVGEESFFYWNIQFQEQEEGRVSVTRSKIPLSRPKKKSEV